LCSFKTPQFFPAALFTPQAISTPDIHGEIPYGEIS